MQGEREQKRGRENCRCVVEFMLGYDAVCCSFVFITPLCMDWRMEDVGGSTSRCIVHLLHVLREGVYAILILIVIDMEDFEMTMGSTYVRVLVRQLCQHELSDPLGNSRAIHRVLGAFLWKGRQAAEMAKSAGDLRAIAVSFRNCKLCVHSRFEPGVEAQVSSLNTRNAGEKHVQSLGVSLRCSAMVECCKLPYWEQRMEMDGDAGSWSRRLMCGGLGAQESV